MYLFLLLYSIKVASFILSGEAAPLYSLLYDRCLNMHI